MKVFRFGMDFTPTDHPDWLRQLTETEHKVEQAAWDSLVGTWLKTEPKSPVLSKMRGGSFFDGWCFGLMDESGVTLSISSFRFHSKAKARNAFEPYIKWNWAYTPAALRRNHYATTLYREVEKRAFEAGYKRIKSLCMSFEGIALHRSLGHTFYGKEKKRGHLVVDASLSPTLQFPATIPTEARAAFNPHPWTPAELDAFLAAPDFTPPIPPEVPSSLEGLL